MIDEAEFRKLKDRYEKTCLEAERAQGALENLADRLEKEYGCKTIKEAKQMLVTMEEDLVKKEKYYRRVLKDYEEKWKK